MRPLVWFRADLRVRDNTALHRACEAADDGVVGVFVVCPEQWQLHDWADVKVDLLLRTLAELSAALRALRIPLKILEVPRFEGVPEALARLASACGCDALHVNDEYEVNERRRDDRVAARLTNAGLAVHRHTDQVILEPGSVLTNQDRFYTVFTPFKRRWIEVYRDDSAARPPAAPEAQRPIDVSGDDPPRAVRGFARADAGHWPAGEDAAHARLEAFCAERLPTYADDRDFPALHGTSAISPYLTLGTLSPRQCLHAAVQAGGPDAIGGKASAGIWVTELLWREFYKHILVGFPQVSMGRPFQAKANDVPWRRDEADFERWCLGRTGYPLVDAGMRQLLQIGWMHNRLRMLTAMFLTKDLLIDWRWGERFFMRNLVDGDLGPNNGGWQWSASTGTDAQPYFRVFNPVTQSRRFDPDGTFIRRYVPELKGVPVKLIHDPAALAQVDGVRARGYPGPIVDHAQARERAVAVFKGLG